MYSALARRRTNPMFKRSVQSHFASKSTPDTTCGPHRYFQSIAQKNSQAGLAHAPTPQHDFLDTPKIFDRRAQLEAKVHAPPIKSSVQTSQETKMKATIQTLPETKTRLPRPQDVKTQEVETALGQPTVPIYHHGSKFNREPYWQTIPRWKNVTEKQFLSYRWGTANDIQGKYKLYEFLKEVLPETLPPSKEFPHIQTREDFIEDVISGMDLAPMSIRMPPHICASIDWSNPLEDPLRRQFIPLKSAFQPDHPMLTLDSLHETADSPCPGLVHRYTDKCLFIASSHCPLYCRYCTRSYAVGANTETVTKASLKPQRARWQDMLNYIAKTPTINDVVLSGGDSYSLQPQHLRLICDQLNNIEHVRRFRVATKGLCVSPNRTLDPDDTWTDEMIHIAKVARERGKHVAIHTHFNHINEFSWVSREAAQKLFVNGVVVRNQSVLLKGVNDTPQAMGALIRELADNNIIPYYVYAGDLVRGVEDLRTPLRTILDIERDLRGTIAGFMTPQFVVDLPGGGGKRLAASHMSYNEDTGVSTFVAPAVKGRDKENKVYSYYDPLASLSPEAREQWLHPTKSEDPAQL